MLMGKFSLRGVDLPGLTSNEAKVYLALFGVGEPSTVRPVVELSGLAPTTVRDNLAILLSKGLVSRRRLKRGGVYTPSDPAKLLRFCQSKLQALTEGIERLKVVLKVRGSV